MVRLFLLSLQKLRLQSVKNRSPSFVRYQTEGRLASYIHMGGKIGVLVELTAGDETIGKDISMQIAAANRHI